MAVQDAGAARIDNAEQQAQVGMERGIGAFFRGPFFRIIPVEEVYAERARERKGPGVLARCGYWMRCKGDDYNTDEGAEDPNAPAAAPTAKRGKSVTSAADILANKKEAPEDYLGALKRIVLHEVDTDGVYGLTNDELVPLPFDAPTALEYITDVLQGLALVAQSTFVMFIALMLDNDLRAALLGSSYSKAYLPLIKTLVIIYPLVTLLVMTLLIVEQAARKFMYYRLLSMRILVDFENKGLWQGWFFYYFVATWALFNVWCIWGVVKVPDLGASTKADTVQFSTLVIVNLQTLQLLLQYNRLLTSEQRLVSLNMIFERAPVEAQSLLTFTYIIEEAVLRDECLAFAYRGLKVFQKRAVNLLTCGRMGRSWRKGVDAMHFDIADLKAMADNRRVVEANTEQLRAEVMKQAGVTNERRSANPTGGRAPVKIPAVRGSVDVAASTTGDGAVTPVSQMDGPDRHSGGSGSGQPVRPNVADDSDDERETSARVRREAAAARLKEGNWFERVERWFQAYLYKSFYATAHAAQVSVLSGFHSWPFRGDVAYFRLILTLELMGLLVVAGIVAFGIVRATQSRACDIVHRNCGTCMVTADDFLGKCGISYNVTIV